MGRLIGVSYRVKKTTKGEARPTIVAIKSEKKISEYKLASEDDELDFSKGCFPVKWKNVEENEDISGFQPHHCTWRKVKNDEDLSSFKQAHVRQVRTDRGQETQLCMQVPVAFEGLSEGDQVAMVLGAGNILADLLFVKGTKIGVKVFRLPPMYLKEHRPDPDKEQDHINLLLLLEQKPQLFYQVRQPDKDLIDVALKLDLRQEAQRERIAYGNRLRASFVGKTFMEQEEELKRAY